MPSSSQTPTKKKKRKTSEKGASSQRKKKRSSTTAANNNSDDVAVIEHQKVTIQVQKPNAASDPILVSFPGGVPEASSGNSNSNNNSKSSKKKQEAPKFLWRQINPKNKMGRVVEGQDGGDSAAACVYQATSLGMGYDDRCTKMCVGIYDKQTGVLKLHQAASRGTVYALQQHLPNYKEDLEEKTAQLSRSLFDDFGSAKKRKVMKSQRDNKVNVDAVIGAGSVIADSMLDNDNDNGDGGDDFNSNSKKKDTSKMSESNRKAVELARNMTADDAKLPGARSAVIDSVVDAAHAKARGAVLPPCNLEATEVSDAYELHAILGPEAWSFIGRMVDACLANDEEADFCAAVTRGKPGKDDGVIPPPEKRGWNPSVLECLKNAEKKGKPDKARDEGLERNSTKTTSATYQLRCIMMYHYLVKFYCHFHKNAKHRGGKIVAGLEDEQPKFLGIPRDAALMLFDKFTTQQMDDSRQAPILPPEPRADAPANQKPRREVNYNLPRYIMSQQNSHKILTHILLVYMVARGGSKMVVDDLTPLLEDLKMEPKDAASMLKLAGCTVTTGSASTKTRAFLTVPLTFPKPNRGGGRR